MARLQRLVCIPPFCGLRELIYTIASDLCSASKKETKKESKVSKLKKFSKEKVDKKSKKNA
jgi:hypothetical protein